jgi:polyhydroxyalkanoate synthesis regulator phasin
MADQKVGGVNPIAAAVAGVVVGAGAVLAGAVAMTDKNNQKIVADVVGKGKAKVEQTKAEVEREMVANKAKAKKSANAGLDYLDKQVSQAKAGVNKA